MLHGAVANCFLVNFQNNLIEDRKLSLLEGTFNLIFSQILMTYVKRWQIMFEDTYFNEELFVLIFQVKIVCLNVISIYTNCSLDIFFL